MVVSTSSSSAQRSTFSAWLHELARFDDLPLDDAPPLVVGDRLRGRYEVQRLLGRGGMGFVYEVRDEETGEACALKTLRRLSAEHILLLKQEFRAIRRVHCVGVAGMGLGPLAIYLSKLGFTVTGEDDALTDEMRSLLTREGVQLGPVPADAELVACSSAIASTHPAYLAAVKRGLPLVRRGEL